MKHLLVLLSFIPLIGCRSLGGFGSMGHFPAGSPQSVVAKITAEEAAIMGMMVVGAAVLATDKCEFKGEGTDETSNGISGRNALKQAFKYDAYKSGSDTITYKTEQLGFITHKVSAKWYHCKDGPQKIEDIIESKRRKFDFDDLSLFAGSYFHRQGILKQIGDIGPTFGGSWAHYFRSWDTPINRHGLFIIWTFDHFFETNSKFFKPELGDKDFTNYMLGGGYAYRKNIGKRWRFNYKGGFAFNFIEIDSLGGDRSKDDEYSDLTLSTIHKITIDYLFDSSNPYKRKPLRIGPSILYYYTPDMLGKFQNDDEDEVTGGSFAWSLDFTWEIY